jgi:hypothetical protein
VRFCCIAGTIVQRTVTESRGAQRRPAGGISDGAAGARVGVLTMSTGRSEAAGPASNHGQRRLVMLPTTSWRWPGRGPMGRTARPHPANRADPLYGLRDGTPDTRRAQPDHIYRDRLRLRQSAVKYPRPENRPLRLDRQVPGQKFVIANSSGLITARIVGTRSTPICIPAVH